MPFKPEPVQPDFSSLITSLDNSKTQSSNYALYQTIFFLIQNTQRARNLIVKDLEGIDKELSKIFASTFLTVNNETNDFPNSRQLLAGLGITFDDTVPGERTVNASGSFSAGLIPMATGAEPLEIMSDGVGQILLIGFSTSQPI